jgi:hypothetical protein
MISYGCSKRQIDINYQRSFEFCRMEFLVFDIKLKEPLKNVKTRRFPSSSLDLSILSNFLKSILSPSPYKQKSRTEKRVIPIQFSQPLEVTISELDET